MSRSLSSRRSTRSWPTGKGSSVAELLPWITFESGDLETANRLLSQWGHRMGPLHRGWQTATVHFLCHEGTPVALTTVSPLIRERVGGIPWITRANAIELSRVCAERPGLCRVVLRLWREFVFPSLGRQYAISYQDAAEHTGNLYRFDGWERVSRTRSGVDQRSGRRGRDKWVWVWSSESVAAQADRGVT